MPEGKAFAVVKGDGRAVEGRCVVTDILWYCKSQGNQLFVYDGLDATSGRFFCRMSAGNTENLDVHLGEGVEFASGVYVDQSSTDDEVTICFRQES
jgi:hypothetical protein